MKIAGLDIDMDNEDVQIADKHINQISKILFGNSKSRESLKKDLEKDLEQLKKNQKEVVDILLKGKTINKKDAEILSEEYAVEYLHMLLIASEPGDKKEKMIFSTNSKKLLSHQNRFNKKFAPKVILLDLKQTLEMVMKSKKVEPDESDENIFADLNKFPKPKIEKDDLSYIG